MQIGGAAHSTVLLALPVWTRCAARRRARGSSRGRGLPLAPRASGMRSEAPAGRHTRLREGTYPFRARGGASLLEDHNHAQLAREAVVECDPDEAEGDAAEGEEV